MSVGCACHAIYVLMVVYCAVGVGSNYWEEGMTTVWVAIKGKIKNYAFYDYGFNIAHLAQYGK